VHEHNVALRDFARDHRFCEAAKNDELLPPELRATFEGYVRPNRRAGTRNYIGLLPSVNCSASAAKFIAEDLGYGDLEFVPWQIGAVMLRNAPRVAMQKTLQCKSPDSCKRAIDFRSQCG
jgi:D-galactarate dehydratase/altronate hydrolase